MVKRKLKLKSSSLLIIATLLVAVGFLSMSYALISRNLTGENNYVIETGTLDIKIEGESDNITLTDSYPMTDNEGKSLTPYKFTLTNDSNKPLSYSVNLLQETTGNDLNIDLIRYYLAQGENTSGPENLSTTTPIYTGVINANSSLDFKLNIWLDYDATVEQAEGKTFKSKISITATQIIGELYSEGILNGTDPVLTDNLVPVQIDNTGKVTKADLKDKWYSYEDKEWANAVVLKTTTNYANGEEIPESNIESYFVWIPKYSYQLWDLGNYNSLTTTVTDKTQEIKIKFGTNNTSDLNNGECTTPGEAGMTGNCAVGKYMTHPAFLAFEDSTGMWVGKFETGYEDATTTTGAQITSTDTSKIIIKPNVYSWRSNTVGNFFKLGYDYIREDESHIMKNTEWGAVAYLHHSKYGSMTSLRINNNNRYLTGYAATEEPTKGYNSGTSIEGNLIDSVLPGVDGTKTVNYFNANSQTASTTRNYSGIYDMSGGCWEYVMGYTTSATTIGGASEITTLYSDFFTNDAWNKYYDKYTSTGNTKYQDRILGDATGEVGPYFGEKDLDDSTRYKSSWYRDYSLFPNSTYPWFLRGSNLAYGTAAGAFAFSVSDGGVGTGFGFRIVLTPTK